MDSTAISVLAGKKGKGKQSERPHTCVRISEIAGGFADSLPISHCRSLISDKWIHDISHESIL
jgi:hypothetical protein